MNTISKLFFVALSVSVVSAASAYADTGNEVSLLSGKARHERRDYAGAIADFTSVIEREGKNARAYHSRGLAKLDAGDRPGAIADFMKVIDLEPQLAADCFRKDQKDVDRDAGYLSAEDRSRRVFIEDLVPGYAFAFDNSGLLKYIQGNYDGAIEDFSAAIILEPKFALPYKHRGYVKYDLKDFQGAIEDYSKAIRFDRKAAETYRERALAREQSGDADGAMDDFRKAAKLGDPTAMKKIAAMEEAEDPAN